MLYDHRLICRIYHLIYSFVFRTEKNACQWSQDTLKQLLVGLNIESDHFKCTVTDLDKCQGEAIVNNRKGKLIIFYEWDILASWKGNIRGKEETVEGKFNIPNLSEENDISEVDVNFRISYNIKVNIPNLFNPR